MELLDGILGQVGNNVDVANLAEKIGLPADQVEKGIAMLAKKHTEPGDTVTEAASATGIGQDQLSQIVDQIGGEGSLQKFAELIGADEGLMGKIGGLLDRDGDGNPLDDISDMASGFFKK